MFFIENSAITWNTVKQNQLRYRHVKLNILQPRLHLVKSYGSSDS